VPNLQKYLRRASIIIKNGSSRSSARTRRHNVTLLVRSAEILRSRANVRPGNMQLTINVMYQRIMCFNLLSLALGGKQDYEKFCE
jgi:hypothetical protein